MRALSLLTVIVAIACGRSGARPATGSTFSDSVDDAGPDAASAAPGDGQIMKETLERARVIQDEVAALRELKFTHAVPAKQQSVSEFRRILVAEVEKSFPTAKSKRVSTALHHLGVLKERIDLATAVIELSAGQVAAYYNPETGTFYAVKPSSNRAWLEVMTAHELVHGLQDQNFDLRRYVGEPSPTSPTRVEFSEDQLNARRFVVEGEATMLMWVYKSAKDQGSDFGTGAVTDAIMRQTRMILSVQASQHWRTMVKQADAEGQTGATKLSALPPFVVVPALESYTLGAVAAFVAYQAGGWDAVNDLFRSPPESTEQVLHPTEKLIGTRDHPTVVTLPDLSKRHGQALVTETLGELGWRVYFETWEVPGANPAAAGWDGDRIAVYQTKSGLLGLAAFVFDSEDDAVEFENAFRRSLRARTNRGTDVGDASRYARGDGTEIVASRDGARFFVVDGSSGSRADSYMTLLKSDATFIEPQP